jgi:hypothetical protein
MLNWYRDLYERTGLHIDLKKVQVVGANCYNGALPIKVSPMGISHLAPVVVSGRGDMCVHVRQNELRAWQPQIAGRDFSDLL